MNVPVFLSELVRTIVIMTISGSLVAVLLLLIKPLVRYRLPKSAQYIFWLTVLAAFLVPVSKIITLPQAVSEISPIQNVIEQNVISTTEARERPTNLAVIQPVYSSEAVVLPPEEPGLITKAVTGFMIIYPIVFALVLICNLTGYINFVKNLRRSFIAPYTEEINILDELTNGKNTPRLMISRYAATPMLIGILKPMIVLPNREYTPEQLKSILLHELTHMQRLDIAVKWLTLLSCAVHWFNPLMWITKQEIDRYCELSCDEAVIRNMNKNQKQQYGDTLISVASSGKFPLPVISTTMCEEKRTLKERLNAIMKSKKHTKTAVLISILILVTAVTAACITGASGNLQERSSTDVQDIIPAEGLLEEFEEHEIPQMFQYHIMQYIENATAKLNIFIEETETFRQANILGTKINSFELLHGSKNVLEPSQTLEMVRLDFMVLTDDLEDGNIRWGTFTPDSDGWVGKHTGWHEADVIMIFSVPAGSSRTEFFGVLNRWDAYEITDAETPESIAENAERMLEKFLGTEIKDSYTLMGYIRDFYPDTMTFDFDRIDWITLDNGENFSDLGIEYSELPNGFYIHNPDERIETRSFTDSTRFWILNTDIQHDEVDMVNFAENINDYSPYIVEFSTDGETLSITEKYIP